MTEAKSCNANAQFLRESARYLLSAAGEHDGSAPDVAHEYRERAGQLERFAGQAEAEAREGEPCAK